MLDKIEMSLDEIIRTSKTPRQGGQGRRQGVNNRRNNQPQRGNKGPGIRRTGPQTGRIQKRTPGGGGGAGFSRGDVNSTWTHDLFDGPRNRAGQGFTKLLISNLDFGVSESDIKELFSEFGGLRSSSIHYDRSGRSLGTADIVYEKRVYALKAMKTYNGVPLDGRPMNIQLATSEVTPQRPQNLRVGNRVPQRNIQQRGGPRRQSGGGGAGAPRGGQRNGGGRQRRPAPTAEELDAELDAYTKDMK